MKLYIVYNPTSGAGRGKIVANELYEYLKENNIDVFLSESKSKKDLMSLVSKNAKSFDLIFICGGDGTFRDSIEAIQLIGADVPLALIPAGSGNDFAKSIGIEAETRELADIYLQSGDIYVYGIKCNDKFLINIFGVGIDTAILKRRLSYKFIKGSFSYMLSALVTLFSYKPRRYRLRLDDKEIIDSLYIISVCNGNYFGGGMMIGPDADYLSPEFQILTMPKSNVFRLIKAFSHIYKGTHTSLPYVNSYKASRVEINFLDGEEYYNIDGDIVLANEKLILSKTDAPSIRLKKPYL